MRSTKWKKIFIKAILPYVVASVCFLIFYSLINLFFVVKLKLIEPNEITGLFIPMGISGLIVIFYLRKKIAKFKIEDKSRWGIWLFAWVGLLFPVMMAQIFVENQSAKITTLTTVDQIFKYETSKYYSIKKATPKKMFTGSFITQYSINKGNETGIGCYYACPLSDFINLYGANNVWIGVCFNNTYSDGLLTNEIEKKRLIQAFIDSSETKYKSYNYPINYLERQYLSESNEYVQAINQTNLKYDINKLVILTEPITSYEDRTDGTGSIALISLLAGNLFWAFACIFSNLESYSDYC